jgi:ABC-type Fe3+-citrate transport system substrate-binding protein
MQLNPVSYEKKNSLTSSDYSVKENGFIAQELQKVMPTLVVEGADKDKLLSVNYTAIIPVLTKAIQEQQKAIQEQKKAIQDQQNQISELKKMVELLMKK